MPWLAKAQELFRSQYAAVGAAGTASLPAAATLLEQATTRLADDVQIAALNQRPYIERQSAAIHQCVAAYRHYCWNLNSVDDLKLAPFHLLATEGKVHVGQNHIWHMDTLAQIYEANPKLLLATTYKMIELLNPVSEVTGIAWWKELTKRGGEGMVVKPLDFIVRGTRGLIQPAVKCRGPEYLRIIYGPEYDSPENLRRLRSRHPWGERVGGAYQFRVGSNSWEQKCLRSARLKRRSQIPRRR